MARILPLRLTNRTQARQFGAQLRRLRKQAGLSQAQLAAAVGISPSFIGVIERGHAGVTPAFLNDLKEACRSAIT
jgi:hypothetical protein